MSSDRPPIPRALLATVALASLASGTQIRAQERMIRVEAAPRAEMRIVEQDRFIQLHAGQRPGLHIDERQFNSLVFRNNQSAEEIRRGIDAQVEARINEIDRDCILTPEQAEQLRLAARGDVERFFAVIDQQRDALQGNSVDNEKLQEVLQTLQPIQQRYRAGIFDDKALLSKVTETILDDDQVARREEAIRERCAFNYQTNVDLFISSARTMLGLTEAQANRFAEVVHEETRPPRRRAMNHPAHESIHVLYNIASLPEDSLRPIFDEDQWRVLRSHIKEYERYFQQLQVWGLIDDDKEAPE